MADASDGAPPLVDHEWLATLCDEAADAGGVLLCLDYDGTLAPIVEDPDEAAMTEGARDLLETLAAAPTVAVGVVSGRELSDLRGRVEVDGVYYAGNHGLEIDDGDGRTVPERAEAARAELADAVSTLREELADVPGCRIEDKGVTATVHYRQVPDDATPEVLSTAREVAESSDRLRGSRGREIVELRPDVRTGKDRAVDRFRERHPDHVPLFVGDDVTDEDGFRAVAANGSGVLVGDRTDTAASVRVPGPEGVVMLLGWLAHSFVDAEGEGPAG